MELFDRTARWFRWSSTGCACRGFHCTKGLCRLKRSSCSRVVPHGVAVKDTSASAKHGITLGSDAKVAGHLRVNSTVLILGYPNTGRGWCAKRVQEAQRSKVLLQIMRPKNGVTGSRAFTDHPEFANLSSDEFISALMSGGGNPRIIVSSLADVLSVLDDREGMASLPQSGGFERIKQWLPSSIRRYLSLNPELSRMHSMVPRTLERHLEKIEKLGIGVVLHAVSEGDANSLVEDFLGNADSTAQTSVIASARVEPEHVIIPLLRTNAVSLKDRSEGKTLTDRLRMLSGRVEAESTAWEFLASVFGLSFWSPELAREVESLGASGGEVVGGLSAFVAGVGGGMVFLGPVGVLLIGLSSVLSYHLDKREAGLDRIVKSRSAWRNLPQEKRVALGEKLDLRYGFPSGSSFGFLDAWFQSRDEEFQETVKDLGARIERLNELLADLLDQVQALKSAVREQDERLTRVERTLEAHEERLASVETRVDSALDQINAILSRLGEHLKPIANIGEMRSRIPSLGWTALRKPVLNKKLNGLVTKATAIALSNESRRIVIEGEAGTGKTTLLYVVCEELISQGKNVFLLPVGARSVDIGNLQKGDILLVDDVPRNHGLLESLNGVQFTTVATARTQEWVDSHQQGWVEVAVTPKEDFDFETLGRILSDLLRSEGVSSSKGGRDLALEKSNRIPFYLEALVAWLKAKNEGLTNLSALNAPPEFYGVIAETVRSLVHTEEGRASLTACFVIARTARLRLQSEQLSIALKALGTSGTHSLDLLSRTPDYYGLPHDAYQDVLLMNWEDLGINSSVPNFLLDLRAKDYSPVIRKAIESWAKDSDPGLLDRSHFILGLQIAFENSPDLINKLLPNFIRELGREPPLLPKIASVLEEAGSWQSGQGHWTAAFSPLRAAVAIYRNLARSSPDDYLPKLAIALSRLGNVGGGGTQLRGLLRCY